MTDKSLEKTILLDVYDSSDKIIPARTRISYLKNHNWYNYLLQRYTDNSTDKISEIIYRIKNNIDELPVCKECGNPLKYNGVGYPVFCSRKCSNNNTEVKAKNASSVSVSLKSSYKTRGDEIKIKRLHTLQEKYSSVINCSSPFGYKEVQENIKSTVNEKYGVDNVFCLKEMRSDKEIFRNKSIELWRSRGYDIEYTPNDTVIVHNACSIHGDIEFDLSMFNNRTKPERIHSSVICPICNKKHNVSGYEMALKDILTNWHIEFIEHDRKTISPLELDFYIPDKHVAIEINGLHYHDEDFVPKDYHMNKTKLCEEANIQLIHIWEDDWLYRNDIVLSMLRNKLSLIDNKISARECIIKTVTSEESRRFLSDNHLQGAVNSSYRYGLYYNDELVSLMTFGRTRRSLGAGKDDRVCELYRFANKLNTIVRGGASRLFSYAKEQLKKDFDTIITYAKRDHSDGNLYKVLGFEHVGMTSPGYCWHKGGKRIHRFKFRKSEIIRNDEENNMTEVQIMHSRGYRRCYDSGNYLFKIKINL